MNSAVVVDTCLGKKSEVTLLLRTSRIQTVQVVMTFIAYCIVMAIKLT